MIAHIEALLRYKARGTGAHWSPDNATCFYHELAKDAENRSTWCHISFTIGSGDVESMASSNVELFSILQVRVIA